MEWPQAEYHKLFPEKVLLAIQPLTPLQRGAWLAIWLWLHASERPGLMAPMDLPRLETWSELRSGDWARHRICILARFRFHPGTGSLHDPAIQRAYAEWADLTMRKRSGGRASAQQRSNRRIGSKSESQRPAMYAEFSQPFWEITPITWPEILRILEEKASASAAFQESSKTLGRLFKESSTSGGVGTTPTTSAPAAASAGGAAGDDQPQVTAFIARQSDAQLAALKNRWAREAPPWTAQFHRDLDPRGHRILASLLFNFAALNPALPSESPSPPAEAASA